MTSRPPLGVQQRQPQRSLSGGGLSQRPAHQRTLSQQYLPPSPIRKETFLDFSDNRSDVAQTQYGTPRRGGSRLKLELSNNPITETSIIESPNAIDSSTRVFTPSRVMPLTDASELGEMSPRNSTRGQAVDADAAPLPMPKRRPRFALPTAGRDSNILPPAPVKKDPRPKPYNLEVPSAAPRYQVHHLENKPQGKSAAASLTTNNVTQPITGYADFFAWSGDHPEDHFSESVIRQGFFDKAPISQTETSSAKGALFPALKHKSGLHALSTVFTGVLAQRRHSGQINSPSTFKPPPRVTLTDTKREVWLKDLANPAISLRRLSRTIPHGIRGKVLLDQCLNKNVPTDRAVWLAKCVGANEIRAFKRKGVNNTFVMGGEAKWIRDWTVFVEQFVEGVVSSFGDAEWKSKVNYAIRLATHLYAEHLLDREHYMDWLVSSLENSPHSKLPMWMLITQIYWKDVLRLRRHGRRLVASLLGHLATIQRNPDRDILLPLSSRLLLLISNLMTTTPENFISPQSWMKHRDAVQTLLSADDENLQAAYRAIDVRNEQLVATSVRTQPAARHVLVKMLDASLQAPMSTDLPTQCWNVSLDKSALVRTLLEWCTSLYRPGFTKVYVSSRLLMVWSTFGLDVTAAVLDFVDADPLKELGRKTSTYHLVAELVRSGLFSVSHYIQWLIARGGLHDPADVAPDGPSSTRLLVELPVHVLTESLKTMRANLLSRAAYSVEDETTDAANAITCLKATLGMPLEDGEVVNRKPMPVVRLAKRIKNSSRALKTEIGAWIRTNVIVELEREQKEAKEGPDMQPTTFNAIRTILEAAEDFVILALFLSNVCRTSNVEILASCADTISYHLPTIEAGGSAKIMFDLLMARLRSIVEEQGIAARPLLASLANLAPKIPGLEALGLQLKQELVRNDRSTAVDACSPVSDNMAARLQDEEGELHEEIEKLLMNGTSLDRNTMNRLFQTVVLRLQSGWEAPDEKHRAYAALLTRLRLFDEKHFDTILTKWIFQLRNMKDRPPIRQLFPLMVSLGCLSFSIILATASSEASHSSSQGQSSKYSQEVVQVMTLPVTSNGLLTPEEAYRFSILQSQVPKSHLTEMLALIRSALTEYASCRSRGEVQTLAFDDPDVRTRLMGLLGSLVLADSNAVSKALAIKSPDPAVVKLIDSITTRLLIPTSTEDTQISFDQILELTNEFTLPFTKLKLSLSLASGDTSFDAQERMQSHLELFSKAMDSAIDARNITWTGMLPCLSPEITQHLKNRAQARFLDILPSAKVAAPVGRSQEQSIQMAENLLSVIDTIIRGGSMGRPPQLVPAMVDKLADMWEILGSGDQASKAAMLSHWLPSLLTFLTLHTSTFDTSKASNEVRAKALLVLSGILQELDAMCLPDTPLPVALSQRVFDLALLLVDNLADDVRLQCVRALRETTSDSRLRYLFSFAPSPSENLMLAHKEKPAPGERPRGTGLLGVNALAWQAQQVPERLTLFTFRRWEILNEPTPNVGENDTSLSLTLFDAIKLQ